MQFNRSFRLFLIEFIADTNIYIIEEIQKSTILMTDNSK